MNKNMKFLAHPTATLIKHRFKKQLLKLPDEINYNFAKIIKTVKD